MKTKDSIKDALPQDLAEFFSDFLAKEAGKKNFTLKKYIQLLEDEIKILINN